MPRGGDVLGHIHLPSSTIGSPRLDSQTPNTLKDTGKGEVENTK